MKSSVVVKVFLIVNLLFSIGVTAFGVKIFQDRELVKARTLLMEEAVRELADTVGYGEQQSWEDEPAGEGRLTLGTPATQDQLPGYVAALNTMESVAQTRVDQLSETYETLLVRKQELADTREELRQRTEERDQTRAEVARLEGELAETENTLSDARAELNSIRRTNQSLARQVEDLDRQISQLNEQISTIRNDLELRTGERDRIQKLLAACLRPRNEEGTDEAWQGRTASILAVEPEWNFVVVNKGEVDVLPMYLEATIQRGETRIGKIRIMQVEGKVALAEVITEELASGAYPQAGDTLVF